MLIGDGVTPSNEGRGYVLRRIVRRAVRAMRLLGARTRRSRALVDAAHRRDGPAVPRAGDATRGRIHTVRVAEEGSFLETLRTGRGRSSTPRSRAARQAGGVLTGDRAFTLHDTYGFPIDLTLEMAAEQGLTVDEAGFRALMQEQRRAGQGRQPGAQETRGADTSGLPRAARRGRRDRPSPATARCAPRRCCAGCSSTARSPQAARRGRERRRSCWTARRSTRRPAASSPTRGRLVLADGTVLRGRATCRRRCPTCRCTPRRVVRARRGSGSRCYARGRRRAPPGDLARPHRDAPGAQGAARRARRAAATQAGSMNAPGRFRFDFASPAGRARGRAARRRAADQRGRARRPRGPRVRDVAGRGPADRGDGAVRREVRRRGARRRGRRLRARAVRRHPRRALRPARRGDAARRGVDRLRHAARRGPRRAGRLLLPRPGARAAGPAGRGLQGARGGGARAGRGDAWPGCARPRRSSAQLQAAQVLAARRRARAPARRTSSASRGSASRRRRARRATSCAASRSTSAAGWPPTARASSLVAAGGDRVTLVAAVNDAGRARGLSAGALLKEAAAAVGGKGGGKDDVAQGGGSDAAAHRRGAAPGRAPRRPASRRADVGTAPGVVLAVDVGTVRVGRGRQRPAPGARQPGRDRRRRPGIDRVAALVRRARGRARRRRAADVAVRDVGLGVGRHGAHVRRRLRGRGRARCRSSSSTSG